MLVLYLLYITNIIYFDFTHITAHITHQYFKTNWIILYCSKIIKVIYIYTVLIKYLKMSVLKTTYKNHKTDNQNQLPLYNPSSNDTT